MTPDNKALIEEALVMHKMRPTGLDGTLLKRLADALEAAEADKKRFKQDYEGACELAWKLYCAGMSETLDTFDGVPGPGPESAVQKRVEALNDGWLETESQLQQTQARLEVVHQWAEMNPYSGVHDAPLEVRQALAYKGTGAKILKDRLRRSSLQANKDQ